MQGEGVIFYGAYAHSFEPTEIRVISNGIIAVLDGKIVAVDVEVPEEEQAIAAIKLKFPDTIWQTIILDHGQFLCPGFIDLHVHAPQFPNAGLGYDLPLLEWLKKYTYPCEQKYSDIYHAKRIYKSVVENMLSCGTTTACYFGTIYGKSTLELAKAVASAGQRAFVGKVNMNYDCPDNYGESLEESIEETKTFVNQVLEWNNPLVKPIITPRFAVTCDSKLMSELSLIANENSLHIQTHISENMNEVKRVNDIFHAKNYSDVYDQAGLLTNRTLLAHGVYLSDDELDVIRDRGCTIVHCPNSNLSLKSGVCNVRRLQKHNVKVGLGTDVSGGYSASMLNSMRCAIDVSTHVFFQYSESALTYHEVFYMATIGGAKALSMEDKIGNFEVGKEFDALLIDMRCEILSFNSSDCLSDSEVVQKFIYTGDDRNISRVYVKGVLVKKKMNDV